MDQLHCIRNFVAVVDAGGFAGAARRLNLSPASVTRAVADLESHLGVTLLIRTTRMTRLTDAGEEYVEACRRVLGELEEAARSASGAHATPRGRIVVTAPVLFGNIYVTPLVVKYLLSYPETQAYCQFVDHIVNMDDEGVDVAVRIGELPDSSLQAARVGAVRRVLCASPQYLEARGIPQHPRDLADHVLISPTSLTPFPEWRFAGQEESFTCKLAPALTTTTTDSAISAAVAGFGITRLMSYQISDHLKSGALKTLLPEFESAPSPIHVLHRQGRRPNAKVRALLDILIENLRSNGSLN